jgi:hypothetical protein
VAYNFQGVDGIPRSLTATILVMVTPRSQSMNVPLTGVQAGPHKFSIFVEISVVVSFLSMLQP